jgi:hypothetical protein
VRPTQSFRFSSDISWFPPWARDFATANTGWKDRVVVAIYRRDQPNPERP